MRFGTSILVLLLLLSTAFADILIQDKNLHIESGGLTLTNSYVYSDLIPSPSGLNLGSSSAMWNVYASDVSCSHCITLGSETTGNYIAGISAGTGISVSNASGEGVTAAISLSHPSISCSSGQAIQSFNLGDGSKTCASFLTSCSACDSRFVNVTGDTMSGALTVNGSFTANHSATISLAYNGGGVVKFANNQNDNKVYMEIFSSDQSSSASEFLITGRYAGSLPQFTVHATNASFSGNLSVSGTVTANTVVATSVLQAGDLVFKNNFRFVEDGNNAIVLLNERNQPILRIDDHGNVWIKGQFRRWE